jgi:hypothetical protein
MLAVLYSLGMFMVDLLKPRRRLEVENLSFPKMLSGLGFALQGRIIA